MDNLVAAGHGAQAVEGGDAGSADGGIAGAGDGDVDHPGAQHHPGHADGIGARGAGRSDRKARAAQTVIDGHQAGGAVRHQHRDREGADAARSILEVKLENVKGGIQTTNGRGDQTPRHGWNFAR